MRARNREEAEEREKARGAASPWEGAGGLPAGRPLACLLWVAPGLLDLLRGHSCSSLLATLPSIVCPPARTTSPQGPEERQRGQVSGVGVGPELT